MRLRRSMLFVPGNERRMIEKSSSYGADSLIFDLEDAVSWAKKEAARTTVRDALKELDFCGAEVVVRINPLFAGPEGYLDLERIIVPGLDAVILPKADVQGVEMLVAFIAQTELDKGLTAGSIKIFPLVETARGVMSLSEIVQVSKRIAGVILGAEDLTADLGIKRTTQGEELLYARSLLAMVCRAADIAAIDTPFTDIRDTSGLIYDTNKAKSLGMTGKTAIHPAQIAVIHEALAPDEEEILYARRVVAAVEEANRTGRGVIALDNKMIDAPVAARARRIITQAETAGLIKGGAK